MTTFTDDELKRFKEDLEATEGYDDYFWLSNNELVALIHRLELAEVCLQTTFDSVPELIDMESYQEWRKAAGK